MEQGIRFYRFSPQLDKKVEPGETDNNTLLDMMITAKTYINGDACAQMDTLIPALIACLSETDRYLVHAPLVLASFWDSDYNIDKRNFDVEFLVEIEE